MKSVFKKETFFSVPREALFSLHERPDAFRLLTPASHPVEVQSTASTLKPSQDVVRFSINFLFLKFRFEMVHTVYEPSGLFVDEQRKGLFSSWRHEHRFFRGGWREDPASLMRDQITFAHPLLFLFQPFVKSRLKKLFKERHEITAREVHRPLLESGRTEGKVVAITGGTGLIGKRIIEILTEKGIPVIALVRNPEKAERLFKGGVKPVYWDFRKPREGNWKAELKEATHIVHLAGTPLFSKRWRRAFKKEMEESRVLSTRQLVEALVENGHKPEAFISASAVGIYGKEPNGETDESSEYGDDILAGICRRWEAEAQKLEEFGIRTAQVRIGIVLSTESGALKEMLPLFRTGMGGVLGHPHPWINWIHREDIARIFVMTLFNDGLHGPINGVAPNPVTNRELARTLARILRRPCLLRFPTSLLKVAIGEAAEYASGGPKISSTILAPAGYRFFFDELAPALKNLLA